MEKKSSISLERTGSCGKITPSMESDFFAHPILNSPYEHPARHWQLDATGQPTGAVVESRRRADFITPIPKYRCPSFCYKRLSMSWVISWGIALAILNLFVTMVGRFGDRTRLWVRSTFWVGASLALAGGIYSSYRSTQTSTRLARVEGRLSPQVLTEEQMAAIVKAAQALSGARVEIDSIIGDVPAKALGDDIATALRSVGWNVEQSTPYFLKPGANELLIVIADPGDNPPPAATALASALQAAGLPVSGAHNSQVQAEAVTPMIGERPV